MSETNTNPSPSDTVHSTLVNYWNEPERGRAYLNVIGRTLDRLNGHDEPILNVGCGKGYSTCSYAACGAGLAVGLEIDGDRIQQASEYLEELPELADRTRFVRGTSDRLPFADRSFQGIVMNEALSHYASPDASLEEAHRVLRPQGHLYVFDDNNMLDLRGLLRRRLRRWPPYWQKYESLRRDLLAEFFPNRSDEEIQRLARKTRGTLVDAGEFTELEERAPGFLKKWNTPPRHPVHGNYAEREINPLKLRNRLEEIGFSTELVPTDFSVISPVKRFMKTFLKVLHPISLILSPGFTIVARKDS